MTSGLSSFALGGGATQKQRVSYFYDGNTAMLICQDAISGSPFQPFVNVMETPGSPASLSQTKSAPCRNSY